MAHLAYVPALVPRAARSDANAKLDVSRSAAQVGGLTLAWAVRWPSRRVAGVGVGA
ncbi:MAG TPA: hypothetical protein VHQ00_05790 [Chloroflexota bacterium]|nr:hypothetical protein [Chloroflexota bacterium]